jgi:hypothetical protein
MNSNEYYDNFVVPVLTGQMDEYLEGMIDTIRLRQKDKAPKIWEFKVGDAVKYGNNVRPKYLAGVKGKIVEIRRTKVTVGLEKPVGRFGTRIVTPINLIEKV